MAEVIDGATIAVLADLGANRAPFILDRDPLDAAGSLLTWGAAALSDITAEVISIDATWGATDWQGPLTLAAAGETTLELWDPDRTYDPANDQLSDPPRPGRDVLLQVDGVTFQTLVTDIIAHATGEGITTITCLDAIGEASGQGVAALLPALSTDLQSEALAGYCGWGGRVDQEGAFHSARAQDYIVDNLWAGLQRLAQAELGALFARGTDEKLVLRGRGYLPPPVSPAVVIGWSPGIPTTEMTSEEDRRLVNAVYIAPIDTASPVRVYRDDVSIGLVGGEVAADAAEADLLLVTPAVLELLERLEPLPAPGPEPEPR